MCGHGTHRESLPCSEVVVETAFGHAQRLRDVIDACRMVARQPEGGGGAFQNFHAPAKAARIWMIHVGCLLRHART